MLPPTQTKAIAATTTTTTTTTHILAFPFPAQGHLLPLLDLIHQLALQGLKFTILVTSKNLHLLNSILLTHPNSIQTLILPFPTQPKLPLNVENGKDIGLSGIVPMIASLSKLEDQVIEWFRSHPSPPQAIIYDFFPGFSQQWAEKLKITSISFYTSAAFVTCIFNRLMNNKPNFGDLEVVEIPDIPKSPSSLQEQLLTVFKNCREDDDDCKISIEAVLGNLKSWCCVYNSFYALEGEYLDQLKKDLGHTRVFGVGPLSLMGGCKRVNPDSNEGFGVLKWLDKCPNESVLYVCFGSQKVVTKHQMESLALGLERSGTRFVWVVKAESCQWIPHGFEERVSNHGLVVKVWAPQVEILNHKAVGGFVSHCGWNSILESVVAGVMILAWPMEADQHQNAKLLVDYYGLGVRLCEGGHTVPDSDELARIIRESFNGIIPQKENAKAMKHKALEAVQNGGSSSKDLYECVKELSQNVASII